MPLKIKTGVYLPNYGPFDDASTIASLNHDSGSAS